VHRPGRIVYSNPVETLTSSFCLLWLRVGSHLPELLRWLFLTQYYSVTYRCYLKILKVVGIAVRFIVGWTSILSYLSLYFLGLWLLCGNSIGKQSWSVWIVRKRKKRTLLFYSSFSPISSLSRTLVISSTISQDRISYVSIEWSPPKASNSTWQTQSKLHCTQQ